MVSFIKRLKSFHTKNDNRKETMIMRKVRMLFCVLLIALTVFLVTGCTNRNNTGNGTADGTTGGGTTTESTSGAGTNGAAAGESGGGSPPWVRFQDGEVVVRHGRGQRITGVGSI